MGFVTGLLTLPLAPLRMTVAVADLLRREAMRELYDPATIREQLERVDALRSAGELTEEEAAELEDELVQRLLAGRTDPSGGEG